jgi:WD40 repeat protein
MIVLQARPGPWFELEALAFSPDGRWLATGSDGYPAADRYARAGQVKVWDVLSRREHALVYERRDGFHVVGFSPDGKLLVAGSRDKAVRFWEMQHILIRAGVETGPRKSLRERERLKSDKVVSGLAFHPDGGTLLVARGSASGASARGGQLAVYDLPTLKERERLIDGPDICAVACSADGRVVAAAQKNKGTILYRTATEPIILPQGHAPRARLLAGQPHAGSDGRLVDRTVGPGGAP